MAVRAGEHRRRGDPHGALPAVRRAVERTREAHGEPHEGSEETEGGEEGPHEPRGGDDAGARRVCGQAEDAGDGGGARAGAALRPSTATELAVRGVASPVLLDDERLTLLLLDLDASEGVAHNLVHERPAHGGLDRGLLGRGELVPAADERGEGILRAAGRRRRRRRRHRLGLPEGGAPEERHGGGHGVRSGPGKPRVAGGRFFVPNARAVTRGSDAGDARTPGSNARARARTMPRPERSDATRSDAV